jgi:hypothetical protein
MALKYPDILEHNNPNLPLVDITELKGNSYPLAIISDTGSIPSSKRKVGAIVFTSGSQEFYGFYGQTTSSVDWDEPTNWRSLSTTTGSFTGSFTGTLTGTASWAENALTASYVPASAVVGLNLTQIATGSISASVNLGSDIFTLISSSNTVVSISNVGSISANTVGSTAGLQVNGDTVGSIVLKTTGSSGFAISADQTNGFSIYDINDLNTRFYMNDSGSFGLNTSDVTGYALSVSGSSRFFNNVEITGSLIVNNGITGSLLGTASYATQALSSSFASTASYINTLNQDVIISGTLDLALGGGGTSNLAIAGNAFSQTYLSTNGALVLNPGSGGVGMAGINQYLTLGYIQGQTAGSYLTGSLQGTASFAISSSNAATASYVPASAVVGLNLTQIATGSITASVLIDSPTAFSVVSGSTTLLSVSTASVVTVSNLTVSENLIVNGTASFINTENLLVKDPFILINSGSNSLKDSVLTFSLSPHSQGSL